jgi:hypothetical protein
MVEKNIKEGKEKEKEKFHLIKRRWNYLRY